MVQSLPGFLDLSLNVCSPCQVLGDVYTEVLEATHPLHRGPTDHKRGIVCCVYLQHVSVFGCVVCICSTFLYLIVLRVFAACFCILLRCEYLQHVSVFGCVACICSTFLYLIVLRVFAARFYIWLCYVYLQHVSVFGCVACICSTFRCLIVACICSMFLYLAALHVFAARFCIWLCCMYLLRMGHDFQIFD